MKEILTDWYQSLGLAKKSSCLCKSFELYGERCQLSLESSNFQRKVQKFMRKGLSFISRYRREGRYRFLSNFEFSSEFQMGFKNRETCVRGGDVAASMAVSG